MSRLNLYLKGAARCDEHIVRSNGTDMNRVWQHARDTWQILINQQKKEDERSRLAEGAADAATTR
jgi:hypothetical protein